MDERPEPAVTGPALFAGAVGALLAVAVVLPGPRLGTPWRLAGLLPLSGGAALHGWAWRLFRRRGVDVADRTPPERLVTTGPYRWSRNPMLLGGVLVLLGGALLSGAAGSLVVVPPYAWLCGRLFVRPEERLLARRFGAEYDVYRKRVRRWI